MHIREATEQDIDAMYEISCSVHLSPLYRELIPEQDYPRFVTYYTPKPVRLAFYYEKMIARLYDPDWRLWVAEADSGEIAGFTFAYDDAKAFELKGLFVAEAYQGQGIGRELFAVSCGAAPSGKPVILEVIEQNARAVAMYERAGFEKIGTAQKPYFGANIIRMQKPNK